MASLSPHPGKRMLGEDIIADPKRGQLAAIERLDGVKRIGLLGAGQA
jgi:hypothetical protein